MLLHFLLHLGATRPVTRKALIALFLSAITTMVDTVYTGFLSTFRARLFVSLPSALAAEKLATRLCLQALVTLWYLAISTNRHTLFASLLTACRTSIKRAPCIRLITDLTVNLSAWGDDSFLVWSRGWWAWAKSILSLIF